MGDYERTPPEKAADEVMDDFKGQYRSFTFADVADAVHAMRERWEATEGYDG